MTAFATAKKAIIDWLRAGSGLDADHVIWTDQDRRKPSKPFLRARLKSFTRKGLPFVGMPDANGISDIVTHNNFTLCLEYYTSPASDSIGVLLELGDKLHQEANLQILQAANVVYVSELMGPTDACVMVDGNWEDRAVMDLWMRLPWETTDSGQGVIERVDAEAAYIGVDGITITVEGISIPAA